MLAAVYRGVNDVRLETVPVPEIGPGELLLRVHTCGICGTDLKKIATGSHSAPRIFGHETAGVVAAVGARVQSISARRPGGGLSSHPVRRIAITAATRPLPSARPTRKWAALPASNLPAAASRNMSASWTGLSKRHRRTHSGKCFLRAGLFCRARQYLHEGNRKIGIAARRDGCSDRSGSHRYHS